MKSSDSGPRKQPGAIFIWIFQKDNARIHINPETKAWFLVLPESTREPISYSYTAVL